ncbi:uncharacterized protein [Euwallacea fornicatus]|uniref:uncharacterized protein n=1 Tax=Euwallacea fornicatus TaxID=995702 RepID=UPI00338F0611
MTRKYRAIINFMLVLTVVYGVPFHAQNASNFSEANDKLIHHRQNVTGGVKIEVKQPFIPLLPLMLNIDHNYWVKISKRNKETNNFQLFNNGGNQLSLGNVPNVPSNLLRNGTTNTTGSFVIDKIKQVWPALLTNSPKIFLPVQTVSKFPPVVEHFVQKIQASQSNYIYEDLSRPPTYDKPVYTLSPQDEVLLNIPSSTTIKPVVAITNKTVETQDFNRFDYEDMVNSTEKLFFKNEKNHSSYISSPKTNNCTWNDSKVSEGDNTLRPLSHSIIKTNKILNSIDKKDDHVNNSDLGLPNVVYVRSNDGSQENDNFTSDASNRGNYESKELEGVVNQRIM